jgi:hypothetical protein
VTEHVGVRRAGDVSIGESGRGSISFRVSRVYPRLAVSTQGIGFIRACGHTPSPLFAARDRVLGNHAKFRGQRDRGWLHIGREVEHAIREDVHDFIRRVILPKTDDDSRLRESLVLDIRKTVLQPGNALNREDPTAISLAGLIEKSVEVLP